MSIQITRNQKEKLFANHAEVLTRGPVATLTLRPVLAIFTPSPVRQLLAAMRDGQHLRPDDMLVAYSASRKRPDKTACVLQQADRTCFFAFWDLEMFGARARELGKTVEVLDLADDSIDLTTTCGLLNPFMVDGSRIWIESNGDAGKFELALTWSSPAADRASLRPSLQLYGMDDRRPVELRS